MAQSQSYTYKGGKFHYEISWSDSENIIRFSGKVVMEKIKSSDKNVSKFDSEVEMKMTWTDPNNGTKTASKTGKAGWTSAEWTVPPDAAGKAKVTFGVDDKHLCSFEHTYPTTVYTPTDCIANKVNNGKYEITVNGKGSPQKPVTQIHIERSTDGGGYSELTDISPLSVSNPTGEYSVSAFDLTTNVGHTYRWRTRAQAGGEYSNYKESNGQSYTNPTSDGVTIEVKELGDHLRLLQWEFYDLSAINLKTIQGWIVQVEEFGTGIFLPIGIVPATALITKYTWVHIPISGTSSRYRLVAFGEGGTAIAGSSVTESFDAIPSKPKNVKAYRTSDGNAVVEIEDWAIKIGDIYDKTLNTADEVHIERSIDGGDFVEIAVRDYPVEQYLDLTAIGNRGVRYRVRNSNSKGFSDYVSTGEISLLSKPNPPTLVSPFNGAVGLIDDEEIDLSFQHNPTDGTPQREAELRYKVNDGSWITIEIADEPAYSLDVTEFTPNDAIHWQVKTLGNYEEYSEWSDIYTLVLYRKPQLLITAPINTEPISTLPIILGYSYSDASGTLADLTVQILQNDEIEAEFKPDFGEGESGTYAYPITGFLFDNNTDFEIVVSAVSTTGLVASDSISIYVEYTETSDEGALIPTIIGDKETGLVYISLTQDITPGVEMKTIVEAYLYRTYEGVRELVSEIKQGDTIVDKYAPINEEYTYELLMLTDEDEILLTKYGNRLNSQYSFIYSGNDIFKAKWNPEFDVTMDRPGRVDKNYAGRTYPVSYDSTAVAENCNYSTVLKKRNELIKLKTLMRSGHGQGIWKSADGDTYLAKFRLSYNTKKYKGKQRWNVSLNITRIDNGSTRK